MSSPVTPSDLACSTPKPTSRKVFPAILQNGNLRSVNPYDPPSINQNGIFGHDMLDIPHIIPHPTFEPQITGRQAQEILLSDMIGHPKRFGVYPPVTGGADDLAASRILLDALKPLKSGNGQGLWNVTSPGLSKWYKYPPAVLGMLADDRILRVPDVSVNVMPCGGVADLHHDDAYGTATLIQGSKLWIFYPPTRANLDALCAAYASSKGSRHRIYTPEILRDMAGGVVFHQPQNTTVWVPPFCPHAVFTLQTSILAGREFYAKDKFAQRLANGRVFVAWARAHGVLDLQRNGNVEEMLRHLGAVLRTDDVDLHRETMRAWDEGWAEGTLQALLNGSPHKLGDFLKIWVRYGGEWIECPGCGAGPSDERTGGKLRPTRIWFGRHFKEVHCSNMVV